MGKRESRGHPMAGVIADASPLIALHQIGQISLNERLFGRIFIPALAAIFFGALVVPLLRCASTAQNEHRHSARRIPFHPWPALGERRSTPFWVSFATGATAWLLRVIGLAPTGSVLPSRQAAHAERLGLTYAEFRTAARLAAMFLAWLKGVIADCWANAPYWRS
ncbi:MAG: hypothetical protein QOK37_867 [Thermoanaerobaculia bacterium]|jgi:hypothetical protein|nr:hypothetical protein [Thermoanaerobaculia bacterium]